MLTLEKENTDLKALYRRSLNAVRTALCEAISKVDGTRAQLDPPLGTPAPGLMSTLIANILASSPDTADVGGACGKRKLCVADPGDLPDTVVRRLG